MSFHEATVAALAAHLRTNVAGISKVHAGWPSKNVALSYPSITVVHGQPKIVRCSPRVVSIGAVTNNQATTKYIVGDVTLPLQLDIWTRSKVERDTFYDRVFSLVSPIDPRGFVLQLSSYHNVWVNFLLTGHQFADGEASATLEEWRAILSLEAVGHAMQSQTDYIITEEPVLNFDTPNVIPED